MLAGQRNQPGAIASDGANVYWADAAGIVACAVGGCGGVPTVVVAATSSAVAVHSTHLAFAEMDDTMTDGRIVVVAK